LKKFRVEYFIMLNKLAIKLFLQDYKLYEIHLYMTLLDIYIGT
jgi:hypothetical protein